MTNTHKRFRIAALLALACFLVAFFGSIVPAYALETSVTYTAPKQEDPGDNGGGGTWYYYIDTEAKDGGSVDPEGKTKVRPGADKRVVIAPDEGYEIYDVVVDGKSVGAVGAVLFDNVHRNHTLIAYFVEIEEEVEPTPEPEPEPTPTPPVEDTEDVTPTPDPTPTPKPDPEPTPPVNNTEDKETTPTPPAEETTPPTEETTPEEVEVIVEDSGEDIIFTWVLKPVSDEDNSEAVAVEDPAEEEMDWTDWLMKALCLLPLIILLVYLAYCFTRSYNKKGRGDGNEK